MKFKTSPPLASLMPILTALFFIFSFNNISAQFIPNGDNLYHTRGNVGIGTNTPLKQFHITQVSIMNEESEGAVFRLNHRLVNNEVKGIPNPNPVTNPYDAVWDIENNTGDLLLKYSKTNIGDTPNPSETKFTFSNIGTLTATKFIGDGSGLTNLNIEGTWQSNGNKLYYNDGNVGIGTSDPTAKLSVEGQCVIRKIDDGDALVVLNDAENVPSNTDLIWGRYKYKQDNNPRLLHFSTWDEEKGSRNIFELRNNGDVGINGIVTCIQVKVKQNVWSDFVFEPNYGLTPLKELETYINQNKHLPEIPSEQEIIENGLDLGEMQKLQMQKIEELTLYIIQLNKENKKLQERILKLENE